MAKEEKEFFPENWMKKENIVIVGAGKGGRALLAALLEIKETKIECVIDTNPKAPGIVLAKEHGLECHTDGSIEMLRDNAKIDLILEVTGRSDVFDAIQAIKSPQTSLIGAKGNRTVFSLLEAQNKARHELEAYKENLEKIIADRTKEIEKINKNLRASIAEHEILNERLQQVNNEKTKYLLRSTHQLKAPFAAIQSYMDVIVGGFTGEVPEKTIQVARKVQDRCELLSHSIKQMLEMANLRSCISDNLRKEQCCLGKLVETIVNESHRDMATQNGIEINFKAEGLPLSVKCARNQMAILFTALLDNAIQYSNAGTQINVTAVRRGDTAVITIEDHGIGIREDAIPKVFDEFFRTNEGLKKHADGTGLGLPIVKEIATLHGFKVELSSKMGEGTTVTVLAPLK